MEQWKFVTIMVVIFAFLLKIQPLDSYLTAYLTSPEVNIPLKMVSDGLIPFRLSCSVFGSFLVFLLSDYLRYKPVMIFSSLFGVLAFVCLTFSPTEFGLQLALFGISLITSAEVSYRGYLYAQISNREHYQRATGYVNAGTLSGDCLSGILGQIIVYLDNHDYSTLPYYSLAGVTFATALACFLPAVKNSTYFHVDYVKTDIFSQAVIHNPRIPNYTAEKVDDLNYVERTTITQAFNRIYNDFKHSYTNRMVLKWSYWYIIGMTGYTQVILYIDVLFSYVTGVTDDKHMLLNGLVDSLATLCAAICSYNIGKLNVDWIRYGDTFLTITSMAIGVPLICCYLTNIIVIYVMYIIYLTLVETVLVIVTSQIAMPLKDNCFTLVLGFNTFLAVILSLISSLFFVRIGMSVPGLFLAYGAMYIILGISYGCAVLFKNKTTSHVMTIHLPH